MSMEQHPQQLRHVAEEIEALVGASAHQWQDLPAELLRWRPSPDSWSIQEIIGHLVDSASNNHQRFVRLQLTDRLIFPDYRNENRHWVSIQRYQEAEWPALLALWQKFNRHIAHLIRVVDPDALSHVWVGAGEAEIRLVNLIIGYLEHLKTHIKQVEGQIAEGERRSR